MKNIRKKNCNLIVDLSKFISNKKLSGVVILVCNTTIKFVSKLYPKFNYVSSKKI